MATLYVGASSRFKTISSALKEANKGDSVVVKAGTYKENVRIADDGVTLRAEGVVKIDASGHNGSAGIQIAADYVTVQGFEVYGSNMSGISGTGVHHAKVLDNDVHHNGRCGIYFGKSDLLLIEGNETHHNAFKSGSPSGISVHVPVKQGGNANLEGQFRIVIRDNVSSENVMKHQKKAHTDGNGIILDDWRTTKDASLPVYTGKGLVEGNLVHHNGGEGIQIAWTDNATVRGNIAYHNGQDRKAATTWRGEISNMESSGTVIEDNIAIADKEKYGYLKHNVGISNMSRTSYDNKNVRIDDNFTFNGFEGDKSVRANNDNILPDATRNHLGVDPGITFDGEDFDLAPWSPLIGTGIGDWL